MSRRRCCVPRGAARDAATQKTEQGPHASHTVTSQLQGKSHGRDDSGAASVSETRSMLFERIYKDPGHGFAKFKNAGSVTEFLSHGADFCFFPQSPGSVLSDSWQIYEHRSGGYACEDNQEPEPEHLSRDIRRTSGPRRRLSGGGGSRRAWTGRRPGNDAALPETRRAVAS